MKLYMAGPMSGIPQFNYPAFLGAAELLRKQGFDVYCPAEMDSPELQAAAMASTTGNFTDLGDTGETWGDMLAEDVKLIADEVDGVVLLNGWQNSRGARLEAFVALQLQKPVFELSEGVGPEDAIPVHIAMHIISNYTVTQGDVSRSTGE